MSFLRFDFFVITVGLFLGFTVIGQSVFNGTGTGIIPDSSSVLPGVYGDPLNVAFDVNGLAGTVQSVSLSMTLTHPYVGDLDVVLTPPAASGVGSFTIFTRVGNTDPINGNQGAGYASNLNGTYTFSDSGGNLWTAAIADNAHTSLNIPTGDYRPSTTTGAQTSFAADSNFIGLTAGQANGTWTLTFRDGYNGDIGNVSAASLTIGTAVPEPQAYALVAALGLLGFGVYRRVGVPF